MGKVSPKRQSNVFQATELIGTGPRAQPWPPNCLPSPGDTLFSKNARPAHQQVAKETAGVQSTWNRLCDKGPRGTQHALQQADWRLVFHGRCLAGKQMCPLALGFSRSGETLQPPRCFLRDIYERLRCGLWSQRPETTPQPSRNKSFQLLSLLRMGVIMPRGVAGTAQ